MWTSTNAKLSGPVDINHFVPLLHKRSYVAVNACDCSKPADSRDSVRTGDSCKRSSMTTRKKIK